MRGFEGKFALVTGGPGGLGFASIVRLVDQGCRVASFDSKALGRQGRPLAVGAAVAFRASDDASFITSSHPVVDAGYLPK